MTLRHFFFFFEDTSPSLRNTLRYHRHHIIISIITNCCHHQATRFNYVGVINCAWFALTYGDAGGESFMPHWSRLITNTASQRLHHHYFSSSPIPRNTITSLFGHINTTPLPAHVIAPLARLSPGWRRNITEYWFAEQTYQKERRATSFHHHMPSSYYFTEVILYGRNGSGIIRHHCSFSLCALVMRVNMVLIERGITPMGTISLRAATRHAHILYRAAACHCLRRHHFITGAGRHSPPPGHHAIHIAHTSPSAELVYLQFSHEKPFHQSTLVIFHATSLGDATHHHFAIIIIIISSRLPLPPRASSNHPTP